MRSLPACRAFQFRTLILALLASLGTASGSAQERGPAVLGSEPGFSLGPAFPNPFERETRVPFVLADELFARGGRPLVSMRVYNLLRQLVGFAYLEVEDGPPRRLDGVPLARPGRYEASWDGRDLRGDRVTEGPYFIQISVNGRTQVRKVLFVR